MAADLTRNAAVLSANFAIRFGELCGTPEKLRVVLEVLRPGVFFWQNDGPISEEDRLNNIRLIATHILPAVRAIGRELNLTSPFEVEPARRLPASGKSVGSIEP